MVVTEEEEEDEEDRGTQGKGRMCLCGGGRTKGGRRIGCEHELPMCGEQAGSSRGLEYPQGYAIAVKAAGDRSAALHI